MDELLDIRREVDAVVSRFRRGPIKASEGIAAAQWDDDFDAQAHLVYDRHVAPALEELDDLLRSRPALSGFFDLGRVATGFGVAGGIAGGLSVVLEGLSQVNPALAGAVGLTGAAVVATAERLGERRTVDSKKQENDWFLYYEARKRLEG